MSLSKFVGRCTILGLIVYLFVKGALILRPKDTVAALSALIAALANSCCGGGGHSEPPPPTVDIRATSSCRASLPRWARRTRIAVAESPPPDARASPT